MIHLYACTEEGKVVGQCTVNDWFDAKAQAVNLRTSHYPAEIYEYESHSQSWCKYYWKVISPLVSLGLSNIGLSQVPNTVRTLHMLEAE